jgi:hypothetical protein
MRSFRQSPFKFRRAKVAACTCVCRNFASRDSVDHRPAASGATGPFLQSLVNGDRDESTVFQRVFSIGSVTRLRQRVERNSQGIERHQGCVSGGPHEFGRARRRGIRLFIFLTSLRGSAGPGPHELGEDSTASPDDGAWPASLGCLGVAETACSA